MTILFVDNPDEHEFEVAVTAAKQACSDIAAQVVQRINRRNVPAPQRTPLNATAEYYGKQPANLPADPPVEVPLGMVTRTWWDGQGACGGYD